MTKNLYLFIFSIFLIFNISFSEGMKGIGLEFHTFPSGVFGDDSFPQSAYFPYEMNGYLVEPQIMYTAYTSEREYDDECSNYDDWDCDGWDRTESQSILMLAVGIYKTYDYDAVRVYAGLKLGSMNSYYEVECEDNDCGMEEDDEGDPAFIFAPTVGAEYYISDNFTFGGEIALNHSSSEEDYNDYDRTTTYKQIVPKFLVRFYF